VHDGGLRLRLAECFENCSKHTDPEPLVDGDAPERHG
jgi:hypothetical protein